MKDYFILNLGLFAEPANTTVTEGMTAEMKTFMTRT